MPITSVSKDPATLTMTVVADFLAPLSRLWDAYVDPRQLERFWGPPTYPATFTRHDAAAGGMSTYAMTGPEGDVSRGYWQWLAVDPLRSFEVHDGFSLPDGSPNAEMPTMRMVFVFEATAQGSRVTTTTYFNSAEELEQLLAMGMEQGMTLAMGQMDDVIADLRTFAADIPASAQLLGENQVRVSRVIRGGVEAVWRAHHEPELMQQWLLGPDGWTMPVCEVARNVGDRYRYEWESGENRFGFEGELLATDPPYRSVTREQMIGMPEPSTLNELTLTAVDGGTLLTVVITYPDSTVREAVLATGMTDGMEASYRRLEDAILTPA
jgi:uncharacterized protein YndB with AHSA1/START domain